MAFFPLAGQVDGDSIIIIMSAKYMGPSEDSQLNQNLKFQGKRKRSTWGHLYWIRLLPRFMLSPLVHLFVIDGKTDAGRGNPKGTLAKYLSGSK